MRLIKKHIGFLATLALVFMISCDWSGGQQKSDSGVEKATVTTKTDAQGHTGEQNNLIGRNVRDNEIGSVKHLYIISAYTGDVLEYSTVRGKVTSGGKRLSPTTVNGDRVGTRGTINWVQIAGESYITDEIPDENGTYGTSTNYIFWFDAQGNYQQYFPSGGTYLHISDKPLRIKKANLSLTLEEEVK